METVAAFPPDPTRDPYDPGCPTRMLIDRIGDKWTVLIVGALKDGPKRFTRLRHDIAGISPKVLTQILRALERDGIVAREIFPEVPPRVEYSLTDLGRALLEPLGALRAWAEVHMDEVLGARERYDDAETAQSEQAG
jgi:DNA-binding HxlR family transcriptional regulator